MKRLTLIRHAKSDWSVAAQSDFERPLNRRGEKAAPLMGNRLAERGFTPDLMISSPAKRARQTVELIAAELGYPLGKIEFGEGIYDAGLKTLVNLLQNLDNRYGNVLLIGHNPGFSELGQWLSEQSPDWLPTCGLLELELAVDQWSAVSPGCATLLRFDFPKNRE